MPDNTDMAAQLLGIAPPSEQQDPAKGNMARLFTLALLRAGRGGCAGEGCGFLVELSDQMVAEARSPFPHPAPQPAPAPPPAAPAAPPRDAAAIEAIAEASAARMMANPE